MPHQAAAEEARKAEEARRLSEQLAAEQRAKEQGDVNRAQGRVDALKRDKVRRTAHGSVAGLVGSGHTEAATLRWNACVAELEPALECMRC